MTKATMLFGKGGKLELAVGVVGFALPPLPQAASDTAATPRIAVT
ncbi:MAG: hypothetical protein ACYDBS_07030 [Acidimicrobiales bacterium]